MKKLTAAIAVLILCLAFASCKKPVEVVESVPNYEPKSGDTVAVFDTSEGVIRAVLYPDYAPKAVENFTTHAKDSYYDGVTFHRVAKDADGGKFVIQSGDPTATGRGGDSIWGEPFANETTPALHHYTGALCMANSGEDQNRSQFYFVLGWTVPESMLAQMEAAGFSSDVMDAYAKYGGRPALDFRYTVFGQVYEGFDVMEAIGSVKTDASEKPLKDVTINSVSIETYTPEPAAEPAEK